jgi:putative SOS response-associated peptidase YedK
MIGDGNREMCGRFIQQLCREERHRLAGLIGEPRNLQPRYNIASTTPIEVIRVTSAADLAQSKA